MNDIYKINQTVTIVIFLNTSKEDLQSFVTIHL